ncbi:UNVERIFIED_CONTAM: hypothetical protein FKN15_029285 [Acipenser sinensis]
MRMNIDKQAGTQHNVSLGGALVPSQPLPMDITAKMEINASQQQFMPPACFFAAAAQNVQLSPTDSQCSSKSASKQVKRQRSSSPELLRCKRRLNFAGQEA